MNSKSYIDVKKNAASTPCPVLYQCMYPTLGWTGYKNMTWENGSREICPSVVPRTALKDLIYPTESGRHQGSFCWHLNFFPLGTVKG